MSKPIRNEGLGVGEEALQDGKSHEKAGVERGCMTGQGANVRSQRAS